MSLQEKQHVVLEKIILVNDIDFYIEEEIFIGCKRLEELNLKKGDIIEFDARASKYYKRELVGMFSPFYRKELDYKLKYPTNIKIVSRGKRSIELNKNIDKKDKLNLIKEAEIKDKEHSINILLITHKKNLGKMKQKF